MSDHDANLARIQALRGQSWMSAQGPVPIHHAPTLDHVEDVLTRHYPSVTWAGTEPLVRCGCRYETWPCPDHTSALTLLDALDGGGDG